MIQRWWHCFIFPKFPTGRWDCDGDNDGTALLEFCGRRRITYSLNGSPAPATVYVPQGQHQHWLLCFPRPQISGHVADIGFQVAHSSQVPQFLRAIKYLLTVLESGRTIIQLKSVCFLGNTAYRIGNFTTTCLRFSSTCQNAQARRQ